MYVMQVRYTIETRAIGILWKHNSSILREIKTEKKTRR